MNMDSPTGTGNLEITNISIGPSSTSMDFEGQVDGYGTVFASHVLQSEVRLLERLEPSFSMALFFRLPTAAHLLVRDPLYRSAFQTLSIMAPLTL